MLRAALHLPAPGASAIAIKLNRIPVPLIPAKAGIQNYHCLDPGPTAKRSNHICAPSRAGAGMSGVCVVVVRPV
jgi:hypothetical protein